jgi:hypothetical protein
MELFEASIERQNRLIKTVASAMGATFEDEEEEEKPKSGFDGSGNRHFTLEGGQSGSPFNIGVGTINNSSE